MSTLHDPQFTTLLFSVMVNKLGGAAEITQDDIDAVAYNRLEEEVREDGSIVFRLIVRRQTA